MVNKCAICNRSKLNDSHYCRYHKKTYEKLLSSYRKWKNVIDLSWGEYLQKIIKLKETGDWARQVAAHQLKIIES